MDFKYAEEQDCFHCPNGQVLKLKREDKNGNRIYQGKAAECAGCQYHARCCQSQKGEARTVNTDSHEGARQKMRERIPPFHLCPEGVGIGTKAQSVWLPKTSKIE